MSYNNVWTKEKHEAFKTYMSVTKLHENNYYSKSKKEKGEWLMLEMYKFHKRYEEIHPDPRLSQSGPGTVPG